MPFNRVLRREPRRVVIRVIRHALHELGIEAVAVYSTADADSLHTRLADRAVCASGRRPRSTVTCASCRSSRRPRRHAVTPCTRGGVPGGEPGLRHGLRAERAVFVGPSADVMERMGDKTHAKSELRAAGVPVLPGHGRADDVRGGPARRR